MAVMVCRCSPQSPPACLFQSNLSIIHMYSHYTWLWLSPALTVSEAPSTLVIRHRRTSWLGCYKFTGVRPWSRSTVIVWQSLSNSYLLFPRKYQVFHAVPLVPNGLILSSPPGHSAPLPQLSAWHWSVKPRLKQSPHPASCLIHAPKRSTLHLALIEMIGAHL